METALLLHLIIKVILKEFSSKRENKNQTSVLHHPERNLMTFCIDFWADFFLTITWPWLLTLLLYVVIPSVSFRILL